VKVSSFSSFRIFQGCDYLVQSISIINKKYCFHFHILKNGDSILAVGLLDMSSFAKFIIKGETKSVVNYLQTLCSNDVDIPVGGIIPTGMLNENGDSPLSIE